MKTTLLATSACLLIGSLPVCGAVVFADSQSGSDTAYDGSASATDLVNQATSTLVSGTYAPSYGEGTWNADGINDGISSTTVTGETSLYGLAPGNFPAVSTMTLNLSVNTLGYDLTSITSIAGWNNTSVGYGNQKLTVEYSVVGSAAFATLFANHNFGTLAGTGATKVVATSDSGPLATGVDAIRVTYLDPDTGSRTIIREFDVQGIATIPEPSAIMLGGLGVLGLLRRRRA